MPRWTLTFALTAALALGACGDETAQMDSAADARPVVLATTSSTQDSGLLEVLIPAFEEASGHTVKTVAVGSGQAIEMARRGEADVVVAHSPSAEQALMASGVAGTREVVMHNDFVVIGPDSDPAGAAGKPAVEAFAAIAHAEAPFVSRGDESGTHAKEESLWEDAGVEPAGSWYQETGSGMGATLSVAAEKEAYTLADRATFLSNPRAKGLRVFVDGGPGLLNIYHVIDIDEDAGPRVNAEGGDAFARWVVSEPAQQLIGAFGMEEYGQALFTADAGRTPDEIESGR